MTWKTKLNEHRELRKQGAKLLYARVKLLIEVYEDAEFREWCEVSETDDVEYMDDQVADVACEFMTLKAVMAEFPKEEQWQERNIRELIAEVLDANRKRRTSDRETERISWKQKALELERECEQLRSAMAAQEARIDELHNVISLMKNEDRKVAAA